MPVGLHAHETPELPVTKPAPTLPDPCVDPRPPCPVCGGLECLCRPRFFPGQLLSDDDLNRLQGYVIAKNRLHNRHLVGWGVACGLEVVCNPCEPGSVIVRAGYALSPCGDDIVVCGDQAVDICRLIDACRPVTAPICDPPVDQPPGECRDADERWVLAVCYDERPSRGITALTGSSDTACCSACPCGGSGSCGCGGAGKPGGCRCGSPSAGRSCNGSSSNGCSCGAKASRYGNVARKPFTAMCEPTQVCETYRFTAYKAPAPVRGLPGLPDRPLDIGAVGTASGDLMIAWLYANRARFGPLLERALCCVLRAMELRAQILEERDFNTRVAIAAYREYAQALHEFAREFALHRCAFVPEVRDQYDAAVAWTRDRASVERLGAADRAELGDRVQQLNRSWMQIVTECFCSALLPACPPSQHSNCVPLAVVTVRKGKTCRVLEICNWEERKILITWPTILYWLSWLPWHRLRAWIARICCAPDRERNAYTMMMTMLGVALAGWRQAPRTAEAMRREAPEREPGVGGVGERTGFDAAMEADNLMQHVLRDYERARSGKVDDVPEWAALAARLVDGSALAPLAGSAALERADVADLARELGIERLQAQVEALEQTVQRQNEVIAALRVIDTRRG